MNVSSYKRTFSFLIACFFLFIFAQTALSKDAAKAPPMPSEGAPPSMLISNPNFEFGQAMEGTEVTHEYPVKNIGTGVLTIERVRTSCGCTIAHYDQEIPPGGEGKITLKLNLKGLQGKLSKTATVYSNDPANPQITLKLDGTVTALIEVKPTTNVVFRGMLDQISESVLQLTSTTQPFRITSVDTNINDNIDYKLDTITDGKEYRLRITNKTRRGNFAGYVRLVTDLAQKPDVLIRVNGFIEGELSIKPQTLLIGRLSTNQPERLGKVVVTSNRNKPFHITRLVYDEKLMTVSQSPLEKDSGYSLEISPKLDGVPVGARRQTSLVVETDLTPGDKDEIQIHLFNSADQPEAQTAPK